MSERLSSLLRKVIVWGMLMTDVVDISADSFHEEIIEKEGPIVLEFFSHSCPHCIRFSPVYRKLAEALGDQARFMRIDVLSSAENQALAHSRGVHTVPTMEVFYRGRVIGTVVGNHHLERACEAVGGFLTNKDAYVGPGTSLRGSHERKAGPRKLKFSIKTCQIRWHRTANVSGKDRELIKKNLQTMSEVIQKAMDYTREEGKGGRVAEVRLSVRPNIYLMVEYCPEGWHFILETFTECIAEIMCEGEPFVGVLEKGEYEAETV